jgi:leucyl-tRNA synthetase
LLAPFAPHIAEELWAKLGESYSVHMAQWPQFDPSKFVSDAAKVAVQVNGKVRATIELAPDASEAEALNVARAAAGKWLEGGEKKVVYVPGKVVNFVV